MATVKYNLKDEINDAQLQALRELGVAAQDFYQDCSVSISYEAALGTSTITIEVAEKRAPRVTSF